MDVQKAEVTRSAEGPGWWKVAFWIRLPDESDVTLAMIPAILRKIAGSMEAER